MDRQQIKNNIRRILLQNGPSSKKELSLKTALSFPTVGRIIDGMIENGELLENGLGESEGGRCAKLYGINPRYQLLLSIRLEVDELYWFITDLHGELLEKDNVLCSRGILSRLEQIIENAKRSFPSLSAISLGLAGTIFEGRVVEHDFYGELKGMNLKAHLCRFSGIPVAIENDMAALSKGYWQRSERNSGALICIYYGKAGIGGGIVLDGRVWHGTSNFAGELHYLPILKDHLNVAGNGFDGVDMMRYYGKIIRCYTAILNPDKVVLYVNDFIRNRLDDIRRECVENLPVHAVPMLELSENFETDYNAGLMAIARDLLI